MTSTSIRLLALVVLVTLSTSVTKSEPIKLTYWRHNSQAEVTAIKELISRFEESNKDTKIILRTFPYSVYTTKLVATLSTGEGPDIINIHNSWAYSYIKAGLLVPVPESVISKRELKTQFFPMLSSFSQHGIYYGLPLGATNLALFYNRRLFKEAGLSPDHPPKTWHEFKSMAKKLTKRDRANRIIQSGAAIGLAAGQGWNYFIEGVLRQAGVPVISDDLQKIGWNTPEGVKAFDWFVGFVTKDKVYSHLLPAEYDAFRLELAAMMVNGSFQIGQMKTVAPNLDYGIAPLPTGPNGKRATYGSLWGNCVTRVSAPKRQAAAWKFIAFLSKYENQKYWSHNTGELPMRRQVLHDIEFKQSHERYIPFIEQLPVSYASVKKDEAAYKRAMVEAVEQMVYNDMDAATAVKRAAKSINEMLSSK